MILSTKIKQKELKNFYLLQSTDENIQRFVPQLVETFSNYHGYELEQSAEIKLGQNYIKMVIDDSVNPLHYGYRVENGDIILFAGGAYSMKAAVHDFIKLIQTEQSWTEMNLQNGNKVTRSLLDNPDGIRRPSDSELRLMSCNLLATFWDDYSAVEEIGFEMRSEIFKSYLQVYDPDVIGLQEVCNDWI